MGCQSIAGLPPALYRWYPFIHVGGETQCGQINFLPKKTTVGHHFCYSHNMNGWWTVNIEMRNWFSSPGIELRIPWSQFWHANHYFSLSCFLPAWIFLLSPAFSFLILKPFHRYVLSCNFTQRQNVGRVLYVKTTHVRTEATVVEGIKPCCYQKKKWKIGSNRLLFLLPLSPQCAYVWL